MFQLIFHSVKLTNYKSIGEEDFSELIIEPKITAIIGKNESGKSNVLSGLSYISFTDDMQSAFKEDNINRNAIEDDKEIQYKIILKPENDELEKFRSDTEINISKNKFVISGGISDYYTHNIYPLVLELCETLDTNPFNLLNAELKNYANHIDLLKNSKNLEIQKITKALDYIYQRKDKVSEDKRTAVNQQINTLRQKWIEFVDMFPKVFYRKSDKNLNAQYKYEDIKKELRNPSAYPKSSLSDFLRLIKISNDDFLLATQTGVSGKKTTLRKKIQRNIEEYINNEFISFYKVEKIFLSADFDANTVYFSVHSEDNQSLLLSERSDGLKWYLNTFIDAKAHEIGNTNVLYLLDEPGISLHVNAQKELLKFFNHLTNNGNQVVYTTHSPYMLNTKNGGIHKIRAVIKDKNGNTLIYKTAYDSRIATINQQDTLTPIIYALGMNLCDTISPAKDKTNIVTEGISDYIYLNTMAKILNIDTEKFVIIPSFGASNCVNICSILHGWGCKYIAVFDYDKAGVESGGEVMSKKLFLNYGEHFCYVKDVSKEDIKDKTYKQNKFMIEDLILREEINRFYIENQVSNLDKTLTAKLLCDAILSGKFKLCQKTKNNFQNLFDRIL